MNDGGNNKRGCVAPEICGAAEDWLDENAAAGTDEVIKGEDGSAVFGSDKAIEIGLAGGHQDCGEQTPDENEDER